MITCFDFDIQGAIPLISLQLELLENCMQNVKVIFLVLKAISKL